MFFGLFIVQKGCENDYCIAILHYFWTNILVQKYCRITIVPKSCRITIIVKKM